MSFAPARAVSPASWTLRTRLLLGLLALLAAVSVVIGVVSVTALDRFLLDRVDQQLTAAVSRSQQYEGGSRDRDGPPPDIDQQPGCRVPFLDARGQGEGTLGASVDAGAVDQAAVLDSSGSCSPLSAAQAAELARVPADGAVHAVDLGGTLGAYHVVAVAGPADRALVTGLPLSGVESTVHRLAAVVALVGAAGLLAAGLAGAYVVRVGLRPLGRVTSTAARVAQLPLDRGEVALAERVPPRDADPRTEVGRVGAALNRMLEHVASALAARQASETRVRTFVADASHELRTPLASIRGYAELTRRHRPDLPPDVARALERVESESVRMTGLVEDLLLLARLDAGRPLASAPVDLDRIVVDLVGDAHAAAPDHRWSLRLPEGPVVVRGDAAELHHVVANVLGNARVHTPPGTHVEVELTEQAGAAALAVHDDGPGIPADLQPEVFQRFVRGDGSRSRAQGSTGLGLSIVASVVAAHGGTVDVRSRRGSTLVVVRLPVVDSSPLQRTAGEPARRGGSAPPPTPG